MLYFIGSIAIFKYDTTELLHWMLGLLVFLKTKTYLRLKFEIRVAVYAFA